MPNPNENFLRKLYKWRLQKQEKRYLLALVKENELFTLVFM